MYTLTLRVIEPPDDWEPASDGELRLQGVSEDHWAEVRKTQRDLATIESWKLLRNIVVAPKPGQQGMSFDEQDTCADVSDKLREAGKVGADHVELEKAELKMLQEKFMATQWTVADSRISVVKRDLDEAKETTS